MSDRTVCGVSATGNAINLEAIIAATVGLSDSTVVVIQSWAGDGSHGNTSEGGTGGTGGYAQTITTIGDIISTFDTTELYYYLGDDGTTGSNAGGDGGSGTMVTSVEISIANLWTLDNTLAFAGGGGRGGDDCGYDYENVRGDLDGKLYGLDGANGGNAFALFGSTVYKEGQDTKNNQYDDFFGTLATGGSKTAGGLAGTPGSAEPGGHGFFPAGGVGGNHTDPQVGFRNPTNFGLSDVFGHGGNHGDSAGGGGGGGGGSFAIASTASCSGAPTTRPNNPKNGLGWVQFVFDTGFCE